MDYKEVKKLVKLLKEEDLTVLSVSDDNTHIHIERSGTEVVNQQVSNNIQSNEESNKTSKLIDVTASQIGTFYNQQDENSGETFISVGDTISKGDQVGFIEAMKVFNDVNSNTAGTVEEIVVNNGETVEFGDVLVRVRPEGA